MVSRGATIAAVAAAAVALPAVGAGRDAAAPVPTVAVGYASGTDLAPALRTHPAEVVRRLAALRVAEVRPAGDARATARPRTGSGSAAAAGVRARCSRARGRPRRTPSRP